MGNRKTKPFVGMVRSEESKAAWLQLTCAPVEIIVSETDNGFHVGPAREHRNGRPTRVSTRASAGVFDQRIPYADFHAAVEETAGEIIARPMNANTKAAA